MEFFSLFSRQWSTQRQTNAQTRNKQSKKKNIQYNQINSFAALCLIQEQGMQLGQCTFTKSTI